MPNTAFTNAHLEAGKFLRKPKITRRNSSSALRCFAGSFSLISSVILRDYAYIWVLNKNGFSSQFIKGSLKRHPLQKIEQTSLTKTSWLLWYSSWKQILHLVVLYQDLEQNHRETHETHETHIETLKHHFENHETHIIESLNKNHREKKQPQVFFTTFLLSIPSTWKVRRWRCIEPWAA